MAPTSLPPPDPALVDATTGPLRVGAPPPRRSLRPAALGLLALVLAASLAFVPRAAPPRAMPLVLALPTLHVAAPAPTVRTARPAPAVRGAEPGQRRQRRSAGR